jgi:homoserine O-acetyltransferase
MTKFVGTKLIRRKLSLLFLVVGALASFSTAWGLETPVRHEFVIKNFKTESGVVLPEAHVVYGTYGHLNAARDNVILLPSHYMAKLTGYEWLMGPGKALDPEKLFLVTTELFGNGSSSSPSNTPEPFHGPRFPVMGAQQAFQWAVSYPAFMDRAVATSGTAKTFGHGIVRLEGEIAAITADEKFKGGDYTEEPQAGISAFGMVWAAWLYSPQWWRDELWRTNTKPGTTFNDVVERFRTRFIPGADANNLILQMRTWEKHDVGTTPGFGGDEKEALGSIKVPFLYMPSMTDQYFPVGDARYEAQFMHTVSLLPIPSLWGHPAGAAADPADAKFLNENIAKFLAGKPVAAEKVVPAS